MRAVRSFIPSPVRDRTGGGRKTPDVASQSLFRLGLFRLVGRLLLAVRAEFLALLAMKPLGVSFLGAFEGCRCVRFGGLLVGGGRCRGIALGGGRRGGLRQNGACEQQQGGKGGRGNAG